MNEILAFLAVAALPSPEIISIPKSKISFELVRIEDAKSGISSFRIGRHEVTWGEYALYYEGWRDAKVDGITRPSQPDVVNPRAPFSDGTVQTDKHPALGIGWYGAMGYCEWLSQRTGRHFRLPTEMEWELAAVFSVSEDTAWNSENSGGHSHPVGAFPANPRGLHDLLGNVWELCLEPWSKKRTEAVVRGGGWNTEPKELSRRLRASVKPEKWLLSDPKRPLRAWWLTDAPFVGFRVVSPEDDGRPPRALTEAMEALSISALHVVHPGSAPHWLAQVSGMITYSTGPPLDEVEIKVWFLDKEGKPMPIDPRGKPAFGHAFPALTNSSFPDFRQKPLRAGGIRSFSVTVPRPFDEVGPILVGQLEAKIKWIHFAP